MRIDFESEEGGDLPLMLLQAVGIVGLTVTLIKLLP